MSDIVNVLIEVTAKDGAGSNVVFSQSSSHLKDGKLTFHSPKDEEFNLTFRLVEDDTNYDLKFPDDPRKAFWCKRGNMCPANGEQHDQVTPHKVSDLELEVHNKNKKLRKLSYVLRFKKRDGTWAEYDPIIDNKNREHGNLFFLIVFLAHIEALFHKVFLGGRYTSRH